MNNGIVYTESGKAEKFQGDIIEIVRQMADNSCVLVVSETLEYIDSKKLYDVLQQLLRISGGDFYAVNIDKKSPRALWDYGIKNVMGRSFFLPDDDIYWNVPNGLEVKIQKMYEYIFKILPYRVFVYHPIVN